MLGDGSISQEPMIVRTVSAMRFKCKIMFMVFG